MSSASEMMARSIARKRRRPRRPGAPQRIGAGAGSGTPMSLPTPVRSDTSLGSGPGNGTPYGLPTGETLRPVVTPRKPGFSSFGSGPVRRGGMGLF